MLKQKEITPGLRDYREIQRLYNASFPDDERIPFSRLLKEKNENRQMTAWYEDERLIGMSYVFIHQTAAYLGYLTVEESLRSRGYGSQILAGLLDIYKTRKIIIDIETVDPDASNYEERRKRRDFYLRNGFVRTGCGYYFYNVNYELLSAHGIVQAEEFRELILQHWGPIAEQAIFKTIPLQQ